MIKNLGFGFSGIYSATESIEFVKMCEDAGLDSAWVAEDYFEAGGFSIATACAMATSTIKIGLGVINPYTRHPTLAAMEAATLDEVSEGRALVALGASNKRWMEIQAGIPFIKPITATKECAQIMKGLLTGEEIEFTGQYFKTGKLKLRNKPLRPDQPIFFGL
jgi:5,10-methylenetetrahydromethanopterin reductase